MRLRYAVEAQPTNLTMAYMLCESSKCVLLILLARIFFCDQSLLLCLKVLCLNDLAALSTSEQLQLR